MSISMDGDEETDYASFNYQHVDYRHNETGDNSARSIVTAGVEPLQASGGLDINEVAELVAIRTTASVSGDRFGDAGDTAQGHVQFRGVLGANLDSTTDLLDDGGDLRNELVNEGTVLDENDGADGDLKVQGHDKEEVFYHFLTGNDTPFSSDSGSVGGGGGHIFLNEMINFRDMVGRGPVIDSNDEISIVSNINKNQVETVAEGNLRVTMVWDVATTNDSGRRFSLPP